ncbi:MAG: hypothetical protein VR72_00190 [Clostridiaceae bacterium BRH_c20a]|nr:MAG: hypothetical protein VR72_00190 [Clostridiaceae bacterium BRH_c20a]
MKNYKVKVLPIGIEMSVTQGNTLMKALIEAGIYIEGPCGGRGTCGKCKIEVANPDSQEINPDGTSEIKGESKLACRLEVDRDMVVIVPQAKVDESRKSLLQTELASYERRGRLLKFTVTVPVPSLEKPASDQERLWSALHESASYPMKVEILRMLPDLLRKNKHMVTVVARKGEIVALKAGDTTLELYGIAFDIGTTTLVGSLINLLTGEVLATQSEGNPQRVYGADVISRISYVDNEDQGLYTLQSKVITALNGIVTKLSEDAGIKKESIYEITIVGNTTMTHLLLGVSPVYLARAPYVPAFKTVADIRAQELGLKINPEGYCVIVPNIAGFVGADTVGVILATGLDKSRELRLAIDIGTNGELVLGSEKGLYACSTAAGPAFEGAQIKFGMRAAPGAIERVDITGDVVLQTINSLPSVGICGSGLIDAVAEMLKAGIIDYTGRITDPKGDNDLPVQIRKRIIPGASGFDFVLDYREGNGLDEDLLITQKDIRELQLAKGAILAGIQVLLEELGVREQDITEILLAGAFGTYIRKESAWRIGLVPNLDLERIRAVGNAAGVGSQLVLISEEARERAWEIANGVKYIELSARKDFQDKFMEAIYFPQFGQERKF